MEYIVKASELYQLAKEIINDGMDYVEISLNEAGSEFPACVGFSAGRKNNLDGWENYDDLDVIDPWSDKT